MKINPFMFRGYDLRGVAGKDLNPEIVECIGKAFGTYLKRNGLNQAVVGRDSRATSLSYSEALIRGLRWAGIDIVNIGMTLVGTFYWSQYHLKTKGGVFVTASHNPPEFNGFKFADDFSETLVTEGMNELRRMVEEDDYEKGEAAGNETDIDIREAYFADVLARVPIKKKFRIVVDANCATAGTIAPALLREMGAEVIEKNCEPKPNFYDGTADPTEEKVVERLKQEVLEARADIGFTYDVDGDRIGIVDEKGNIIWNDVLVALFALDALREHPGATIMYNMLCSKVVEDTIIKAGGKPFMWRVGHSFLKKKNQEIKAAFIGELSGHFFFSADFYNHDDGLYSTLRLLQYLSSSGQSLSEAVSGLPRYVSSPEIKVFCADDKKVDLMKKISPILKKDFPTAEVVDDERAGDGIRLDMPDAMFVIRYSQNGPYLTIKFEAKTKERYEELRVYINDLLHGFDEIDWKSEISLNLKSLL